MTNDTKKGLGPLAWIAIGCGGLALLVFIGVVAAGGFAFFKAKEFVDENVDISDEGISITTAEGTLDIDTSGEGGGSVSVTGKDGSVAHLGADASLENVPDWVKDMLYPNATQTQGSFHTKTQQEETGIVSLSTSDSMQEVVDYFKNQLTEAGYEIGNESTTSTPGGEISTISGENADEARTVNVGIIQNDSNVQVTINYNDKN